MIARVNDRGDSRLCIEPDFGTERVVLHPLPRGAAEAGIRAGDEIEGTLGVEHPTERVDKRGLPIVVQYFIPAAMARGNGKEGQR